MDRSRRILFVDDMTMFRELGCLFLARCGWVETAGGGREALDAMQRDAPDVLVADLHMPDLDGAELCRSVKGDPGLARTPVILLCGAGAADRDAAVRAGADDVLPKPINRITLIGAVNRFLRPTGLRGLTRVQLRAPVCIHHPQLEEWGVARNLSRGGIFVEAHADLPPHTEVDLDFRLPDSDTRVSPSAEVMWRRMEAPGQPPGMGMRFLALDRTSIERIDDYVYERSPSLQSRRPRAVRPRALPWSSAG